MPSISHTIEIEAVAESVFNAITQQDSIVGWWTKDASVEAVIGSVAEFGFYNRAIVTRFRIEDLERPGRIRWDCVGGPPEYVGSVVTFDLEPVSAATLVYFEHRDLRGTDDFVAHATQSWRRVLTSLKAYVETGEGTPISM